MGFDLSRAIASAPAGATVDVPAGTWAGGLVVTRALTLRAAGAVVFDGQGAGPLLRINAEAEVTLEGFSFRNAVTLAGAGVFHEAGRLTLRDCSFTGCAATGHGGGAVYSRGESLRIARCRFEGNEGRQGGAVLLDQLVEATVEDSLFIANRARRGAALRVKAGARAHLSFCTVAGNVLLGPPPRGASLEVAPTLTRSPSLSLADTVWSEPLAGGEPGNLALISAVRCVLPKEAPASGSNDVCAAVFVGEGREPWRLVAGGPGTSLAGPCAGHRRDLEGHPRGPVAGAFSQVGPSSR